MEHILTFFLHVYLFSKKNTKTNSFFRDIILEAKSTKQTSWKCDFCALYVPHMHVHKVILWLSCDYLRALLQSGMKERYTLVTFSIFTTIKEGLVWFPM